MRWTPAWGYLPVDYGMTIGEIKNVTQRTFIRNNLSGERIRILFSNRYGTKPLVIMHATIGQKREDEKQTEKIITLSLDDRQQIVLQPGEERYSDIIDWHVSAGSELVLSLYFAQKTEVLSAAQTWAARSWHTIYGIGTDLAEEKIFTGISCVEQFPFLDEDPNKSNIAVGISQIEIETTDEVREIALFGDSITHMSYFADALMEIMYERYPGRVSVVNRGIGGNRLLHDATLVETIPGKGHCFGIAGKDRFERNLYGHDNPQDIVFLEGVNDLMHPYQFGYPAEIIHAGQLEGSVTELCRIAHAHHSSIYPGTVMPFRNDEMNLVFPEAERERKRFNDWIRMQNIADGYVDFAQAMQDENKPEYLKEKLHIGDGLHPNTAGGRVMADTFMNWMGL